MEGDEEEEEVEMADEEDAEDRTVILLESVFLLVILWLLGVLSIGSFLIASTGLSTGCEGVGV